MDSVTRIIKSSFHSIQALARSLARSSLFLLRSERTDGRTGGRIRLPQMDSRFPALGLAAGNCSNPRSSSSSSFLPSVRAIFSPPARLSGFPQLNVECRKPPPQGNGAGRSTHAALDYPRGAILSVRTSSLLNFLEQTGGPPTRRRRPAPACGAADAVPIAPCAGVPGEDPMSALGFRAPNLVPSFSLCLNSLRLCTITYVVSGLCLCVFVRTHELNYVCLLNTV